MFIAVCDFHLPVECENTLGGYGIKCLRLVPWDILPAPVAAHPDMLMFPLGNKVIVSRAYFEYAKSVFDSLSAHTDAEIVLTEETPNNTYPNDIIFNALPLGEHIYGKVECLSSVVTSLALKNGLNKVDIKQGYARCSTCKVTENAVITADKTVADAAKENGVDFLTVTPGHVNLPGYGYGFIGGTSGLCGENVFFCGNLMRHPDGKMIADFCRAHGKTAVSLSDEPLYDVGTLFFFEYR